jgi:hypothetical protein
LNVTDPVGWPGTVALAETAAVNTTRWPTRLSSSDDDTTVSVVAGLTICRSFSETEPSKFPSPS